MSQFVDTNNVVWPQWAKRALQSPPPELSPMGEDEFMQHTRVTNTKTKRVGEPGFKVTQHQLDTDSYLWFRAVKGEDCSRLPALTRPYTYFHAVGSDRAIKVPVTVMNMAYREAAMLARRTSICFESGMRVSYRARNVHNDRVWYLLDDYGDTWVGARLSTMTSLDKAGVGLDYVTKRQLPNVRWTDSTIIQYTPEEHTFKP